MGKLNYHAEKMAPGVRLPECVIHRIGSSRFRPLNQCLPKTNLFDFVGLDSMTRYVINSICRPDEFVNLHSAILDQQSVQPWPRQPLVETASIATAAEETLPAQLRVLIITPFSITSVGAAVFLARYACSSVFLAVTSWRESPQGRSLFHSAHVPAGGHLALRAGAAARG